MDALYAFSDCEINISPNCCVIEDNKPKFLTVSDVLRHSVDRTMGLLRRELMIRKGELEEQLFFSSLERIFIEERIYKERKFEQSKSQDEVVAFIYSSWVVQGSDLHRQYRRQGKCGILLPPGHHTRRHPQAPGNQDAANPEI